MNNVMSRRTGVHSHEFDGIFLPGLHPDVLRKRVGYWG